MRTMTVLSADAPISEASARLMNTPRASGPSPARDVMKLPEPIVDAVDLDARRPSAARLIRDEARHDRDRSNAGERRRERRILMDLVRQRLAEEPGRHDDPVHATEPQQHQVAKAAADGIAHEQRAGQHRHRGRDPDDNREVRTPVVAQAGHDQAAGGHWRRSLVSTRSKRIGNRAASALLWVTTMRMVFCWRCSSSSSVATFSAEA